MAEVLTVLLLTFLMVGLLVRLVVRHARVGGAVAHRMEVVEARRIARDLVDAGITGGGARMTPGGELELRSFVGWAVGCEGAWRYRGRRLPDPDRDSVWVVTSQGEVAVGRLSGTGRGTCEDGDESGLSLIVDAPGAPHVLLRVFESGRYRLTDALRYGRTGDPAQPLTGAVLDPGASGIRVDSTGLTLAVRGAGADRTILRRWTFP